jgi:hypothetical protein
LACPIYKDEYYDPTTVAKIAEITYVPARPPNPLHEVTARWRLDCLAQDMARRGWVGPPVVTLSDTQAITGAHRLAASARVRIPARCVKVADLCRIYGLNWDQLITEYGHWGMAAHMLGSMAAYHRGIDPLLPADVTAYLTYDVADWWGPELPEIRSAA